MGWNSLARESGGQNQATLFSVTTGASLSRAELRGRASGSHTSQRVLRWTRSSHSLQSGFRWERKRRQRSPTMAAGSTPRALLASTRRVLASSRRSSRSMTVAIGIFNVVLLFYLHSTLTAASTADMIKEAFHLYYQPLIPFLVMIWGWGLNVLYFERTGLRYEICFDTDAANSHGHVQSTPLLSSSELLRLSNVLTLALFSSAMIFLRLATQGNVWAAAMQPVALYLCALLVLLMPFPIFHRDARRHFAATLWRVVTPHRTVTWADFLLADILTSLAKGISDIERAVCSMASGPISDTQTMHSLCTDVSWTIPLAIALPYMWRFFQCVRVYRETGNQQQLWNALKYTTAFPVVFLSYAKYHVSHDQWLVLWKPLWLLAAFVNSSFSYFWDIERDWEISFFSLMRRRKSVLVRPALPQPTQISERTYLYLMISNLLLRLSWGYKLSPHLRRDHMVVFCIVILEVLRRCQWIAVRFEVELRKIQNANGSLALVSGKRRLGGIPSSGSPTVSPRII